MATLTDRLTNAAWNRRGSLVQTALGVAKCYAAFKLLETFPHVPEPLGHVIASDPPVGAVKGLTYLYLLGTGMNDFVRGAARTMSNQTADQFFSTEMAIYYLSQLFRNKK